MTDLRDRFSASLIDTHTTALRVDRFVQADTPGNVGVCLSGGGSRALSAGMGQLRALKFLTANGKPLLDQVKAFSTVSGGSWLGVSWAYNSGKSEDDFLNRYVQQQGQLTPERTSPNQPVAEILDELPEGNIGAPVTHKSMDILHLALRAVLLRLIFKTPVNMLWQSVIGHNLLLPNGLFHPGRNYLPTSLFSADAATLQETVINPNPSLAAETAHLLVNTRYVCCNTSLFVSDPNDDEDGFKFLVPVQATPYFTGVVGHPEALDANGQRPGGGGVTSFAFNSILADVAGAQVQVEQSRQWSLTDIVGASSAAFAEFLENILAMWRVDLDHFFDTLMAEIEEVLDWLETHAEASATPIDDVIFGLLQRLARARGESLFARAERAAVKRILQGKIRSVLTDLKDLIPQYEYWPAAHPVPNPALTPNRFADGGSLENTGVASLLAYEDIEKLISFVNTSTPLAPGEKGVIGEDGHEIPDTAIVIDSQLPVLFGYQPYHPAVGYLLYEGDAIPDGEIYKHNQVFPSAQFSELLKTLWANSGSGLFTGPAWAHMTLEVLDNAWFGVHGGRTVEAVFYYNNQVKEWYDLLAPDVRAILGPFDVPEAFHNFPHYATAETQLSATQVNLLANLCAWIVADKTASTIQSLFS